MRHLLAGLMAVAASAASCATFPLEWNASYRTDVPYEVEMFPSRVGAESFRVKADGKYLKADQFAGKAPGSVALRFNVPRGTKSLVCETAKRGRPPCDSSKIDNLFAGALDPSNIGRWRLGGGIRASVIDGGICFRGTDVKPGGRYVTYTVDVPEGLAGMPVMQEMDLRSTAKLVWGGKAHIRQLDAKGNALPESVADVRWTSHMRPPRKLAAYRDEGHIHPEAKKLMVELELRTLGATYDDYGQKISDRSVCLPSLEVTRLAVRPAERLPFPKWNDSFFGGGVSGKPGDASMRLGGQDGNAMFYQLTSRGSWTESVQFREESSRYFPAGAGTVEAWFRPDWAAVESRRKAKDWAVRPVVLFEAYQGYRAAQLLQGQGAMMQLRYRHDEKSLSLDMKDWNGHSYSKTWQGTEFGIPDAAWSHVALQWTPKGVAQVFINGSLKATLPIPEYEAIPIGDESIKNVNDLWAMEFYLGSSCVSTRKRSEVSKDWPLFEGCADNLRVSSGCRYGGDFIPSKEFKVDSDTRALFTFDRAFDGVSGGGFGFIPASILSLADRVDHRLMVDGRPVQYYPAENLPENDPAKVLNIINYPVMPKVSEYRSSRKLLVKTATLAAGDKMRLSCGNTAYPEWVEFENTSKSDQVLYPILVGKGRLDPRSFGDLADSLAIGDMSDKDKANRVFQYVLSASDYFMNHQLCFSAGADAPHSACYEAMIMLNSYCRFECGPLNNLTANLFATVAMCPAAQTGGYGHSFEEVFFDGKNHIYDLSAQKFFPAMDNETASYLKEAGDQPGIFNRIGSDSDSFIRKSTRGHRAQDPSYQERVAMVLNPGERFRVWYSNNGRMNNLQTWRKSGVYGSTGLSLDEYNFAAVAGADEGKSWIKRMDRIFPHYSTGVITFDGAPPEKSPALERVEPDSFCYRVRSCYPIVWGEYAAWRRDGSSIGLELSTDFGKTFRPIPMGKDGVSRLEYRVKGRHDYLLRVKAPLADVARLLARTDGEVNSRTYPGWVEPGENELTFKAERGVNAKVTVAWSEPSKEIVISGGAYSGTIPGRERQLALVDPSVPLTLGVSGVSEGAKVKCFGRLRATLSGGRLTLAYDADSPLAMRRGDDLEAWYASGDPAAPKRSEFPTVAGVEISDCGSVKRLTVIVSPNARLLTPGDAVLKPGAELKAADADSVQDRIWFTSGSGIATFPFPKLPAGKYAVFALARFASHPDSRQCTVDIVNPDPGGNGGEKSFTVARYINGNEDYLKANYARKGERARWKWDTVNLIGKQYGQTTYSGWIIRALDFPETDHVDMRIPWNSSEGVELAAVLLLPDPDLECRADLRKVLFGLNCDPFLVR